jgi:hypothetical protein
VQPNNYIEAKDVLDSTNGGLDIILDLYPQAHICVEDKRKKFKMREEKSASANLHKTTDGTWLVTDFGGDAKPRNGILSWMLERGVDFVDALRQIAAKYGIAGQEQVSEQNRAEYTEEPADPDIEDGLWTWETRGSFTDLEIETIISRNVLKHVGWKDAGETKHKEAYSTIAAKFKYYRWHSLISYSLIKNRKKMTFSATDQYPIFLIDEGKHQKLYQPKHPDKGKRFMYIGEKPKHFIHGLDQLEKEYNRKKAEHEEEDRYDEDGKEKKKKDFKLEEAILCSGGSDGINVALLGYHILWQNSETEGLQGWQYKDIAPKVEKLYQLQDIDHTGKTSSHKLALEYLEVYTIELPEELLLKRDGRGNPCKDVRDYLNHFTRYNFDRLVKSALPYKFWDQVPNYVGRGENQVFVGYKYVIRSLRAINFLHKCGFSRMPLAHDENDWIYIHKNGNVVRQVDAGIMQDYLHNFVKTGYHDEDLREAMLNTTRINEMVLQTIEYTQLDFTDYTPYSQFIFFKNKTIEITRTEIKHHRQGAVNRYIWKDEVHQHNISEIPEAPFIVTKDKLLGTYDIEVKDHNNPFLKYLIQTSRIHWRTELEGERMHNLTPEQREQYAKDNHCVIDGPNLTPDEIDEQKQHLLNKLFVIGWHLHRYKDPTKGWFSWGMDGKMSDDGKSHGGSGKSLLFDRTLRLMMPKNVFINARDPKRVESEFKYDGLDENTRYVLFEDCYEHFKAEQFYVDTNGDIDVNPKGKTKYTVKFSQGPKFAFTSNFMPRDQSPSTLRRILYYVCSDYYHEKGDNGEYLERRTPETDLGLKLFDGFDYDQWNSFYHLMFYCIQFFLNTDEKIRPAMENVNKRNLLTLMGVEFHKWATGYFTEEAGTIDKFIAREEPQKAFNQINNYKITPQQFKTKLAAYCKFYGYILDPTKYQGKNDIIVKKMPAKTYRSGSDTWELETEKAKVAKEVFFIQTRDELPEDPMIGWPAEEDKLDF